MKRIEAIINPFQFRDSQAEVAVARAGALPMEELVRIGTDERAYDAI